VIESWQVQQRGVQVVHMDGVRVVLKPNSSLSANGIRRVRAVPVNWTKFSRLERLLG
jgi:hypothetical protein